MMGCEQNRFKMVLIAFVALGLLLTTTDGSEMARSTAEKVTELKRDLTELKGQFEAFRIEVGGGYDELTELGGRIFGIEQKIDDLSKKVDDNCMGSEKSDWISWLMGALALVVAIQMFQLSWVVLLRKRQKSDKQQYAILTRMLRRKDSALTTGLIESGVSPDDKTVTEYYLETARFLFESEEKKYVIIGANALSEVSRDELDLSTLKEGLKRKGMDKEVCETLQRAIRVLSERIKAAKEGDN